MNRSVKKGEIYRYRPTGTVGKVDDVKEQQGKVWALLDFTKLYYDVSYLEPADESEYRESSYKERKSGDQSGLRSIEELQKNLREVDVSEYTPSGGG